MSSTRRRRTAPRGLAVTAVLAGLAVPAGAAAAVPPAATGTATSGLAAAATTVTVPLYEVASEGLTEESAQRLAKAAGVPVSLRADGSFSYTDAARFATVPRSAVGKGRDEAGNPTVAEALDLKALDAVQVPDGRTALKRAAQLLRVPEGLTATAEVDHTRLDLADAEGRPLRSVDLDTTVSYRYSLGDVPLVGPGARSRVSLAGDGSVLRLTDSLREVRPAGTVEVVDATTARRSCTALTGAEQAEPTLAYYAPPLAAQRASGQGAATLLVPHYVCHDASGDAKDGGAGRLLPAAPSLTPSVRVTASVVDGKVTATAKAGGGTGGLTYRWTSSSTALKDGRGTTVSYTPSRARKGAAERLTLTVTDANGVSALAVVAPTARGGVTVDGVASGPGGAFATNGIEQTVDEWQCAHDSADGFRDELLAHSQSVDFDWRGGAAWERDFKDVTLGGTDTTWVDDVDAQWYTGHGWSGGFTFDSTVDDTSIVPSDARWGDRQLEWLQLESCQVLRDTTGTHDYFGRWDEVFAGLHLLNGFDTNAYCVSGGLGGPFASYLFPETFWGITIRPALTVQQAWAAAAQDVEPSGVRWRSISPATTGWVTNLGDYYWGQGSTGPDIRPGSSSYPLIGYAAVSGVV